MCLSLFDFTNFVSIKILLSEYEEFPAKILHSVKFFCFQSNINQTWSDCSTHEYFNLTKFGQDWTENKKKNYRPKRSKGPFLKKVTSSMDNYGTTLSYVITVRFM